jgi:uncharacterized protein
LSLPTENEANSASTAGRIRLLALLIGGAALIAALVIAVWLALQPEPTVTVRIAAGPEGSDAHEVLEEIAEVAKRHNKPVIADLLPTVDSSQSIAMLNEGKADLAIIRGDTPVSSDVRIVASLFSDHFMMIVRRDASIRTFNDLIGKKISLPPAGSDGFKSFFAIIGHYDVPTEKLNWLAIPLNEARRKLLRGEIDGVFTVRSLRDPIIMRLFDDAELSDTSLDVLPVSQVAAIALKRPLLEASEIAVGALSGEMPAPSISVPSLAVNRILVARSDADPVAVRALTEVMFENRLDLTLRLPLAAAITAPDQTQGLTIPLHEGAAAYFNKDAPNFIEANSNSIGLMLTVAAMVVSGFLAVRSWFLARQKNLGDVFNRRLTALNQRALSAVSGAELAEIKTELAEMLEQIVAALDTDDVTAEGFDTFSRIHEAVSATVRDQEFTLSRSA